MSFASGGTELDRPAFGSAAPLSSALHRAACVVEQSGFEPAILANVFTLFWPLN